MGRGVRRLKVGSSSLVLLAGEGVYLLVGVGRKQLAPIVAECHPADMHARPAYSCPHQHTAHSQAAIQESLGQTLQASPNIPAVPKAQHACQSKLLLKLLWLTEIGKAAPLRRAVCEL